jgi:hypothetical protein
LAPFSRVGSWLLGGQQKASFQTGWLIRSAQAGQEYRFVRTCDWQRDLQKCGPKLPRRASEEAQSIKLLESYLQQGLAGVGFERHWKQACRRSLGTPPAG